MHSQQKVKTRDIVCLRDISTNTLHKGDDDDDDDNNNNVGKYCRTRQATDDNMAHAHCMLDN